MGAVVGVGRRYGVPGGEVREVAGGVANRAFVVGGELFVRVARAGFEGDLRKEVGVVPAVRAVGVRTPEVVEFDESRAVVDAVYVVMERVHGVEPAGASVGVGDELARVHEVRSVEVELPVDGWGDPRVTVEGLAVRGVVDGATAEWLTGWFGRLEQRFDRAAPRVLIHGDVAPHNLLVGADGEPVLVDWGDAAWAPRATEFAKLRLGEVVGMLPRYLAGVGDEAPSEEELAAGILYLQLSWGLSKLAADPWPGQRHWTAPPASRLLGLLQFFTSRPPAPWADLS
nr:aminoglycoside phosphotransferase family protein [Kribbella sandramycini]